MESIKVYLKEIRHIPLLTHKEEIELAKRIEKGDKEARNKMIRSNLRLVISISKRYVNFGVGFMDLIEDGNIGLMRAVDKFKVSKGYRFSTYAAWWIKQAISRSIIDRGKMIRIPVYMNESILKWKRTSEQLQQKLKRPPVTAEIAKKMGVSVAKVRKLGSFTTKMASLEAPIGEESKGQVKDIIEDENLIAPDEELEHFFNKERTVDLLGLMNKRERHILDLRFGLSDGKPHTLAEISRKLGVSRERVRQIEEVALKKLRRFIKQQEGEL
ncbi:MAG: sigma-70 family RNA polymerase sigma factor [Candidatus Omnitrophota bacterium]|nr:sigma-70 family RNA polymerase sigma factor [Candidatus Omnitrophota bacterium]